MVKAHTKLVPTFFMSSSMLFFSRLNYLQSGFLICLSDFLAVFQDYYKYFQISILTQANFTFLKDQAEKQA